VGPFQIVARQQKVRPDVTANESAMPDFGIPYVDAHWPHGLRCGDCDHLMRAGDAYSEQLVSMADELPVVRIVCVVCALS
jgi:hypothetical protein